MERAGPERVEEIYAVSYRRLVAQLVGVTGDLAEAEDVVQDAFAQAVVKRREFDQVANPEAWLRTVAVNRARSRLRRVRHFRRLAPRLVDESSLDGLSPDSVALVTALQALPEAQRTAVALHHLADLSVAEVAETTNTPVNTVKARLVRGRARLADLLSEPSDPAIDPAGNPVRLDILEDRRA